MGYYSSMVLLIPAVLLTLYAQAKIKSAYAKYSKVGTRSGMTGAQVAAEILHSADIAVTDNPTQHPGTVACGIEAIGGRMSDHYDPRARMLRLSNDVYMGQSIAALGIAAHEAGHAVQHAKMYTPLMLRSIVYPVSRIGSGLAMPLFLGGLFFARFQFLMLVGIALYTLAVAFTLITLPVEFNASNRALAALHEGRYLDSDELKGAKKVLSAAAMTYVASAAMALMQLLRMVLLSNRR